MCAFWFRHFFELDLLPEYAMRLDSDTCLTSDLTMSPFQYMHEHGVDYMFHSTVGEPAFVIDELKDFVAEHPGRPQVDHIHDPLLLWHYKNRPGRMEVFSTNLEWYRVPVFRRKEILEWQDEVEKEGGVYRNRWGDAPLRTVVVTKFLNSSRVARFCDFTYNHSIWKPFVGCVDASRGKYLTDAFGWRVAGRTRQGRRLLRKF
jgi:hypothetical protein